MLDIRNEIRPAVALHHATVLAATAGLPVDLLGANAVALVLTLDNTGDVLSDANRFDITVQEAEADATGAPGAFTTIPVVRVMGQTAVVARNTQYSLWVNTLRRFVRLVLTPVGAHTAGNGMNAVAILGRLSAEGKTWG